MVTHMKTTVEIPDALLREVRALTKRDGTTMRELIVEGLRAELERRRTPEPRVDITFPTFGVAGADTWPELAGADFTDMAYGDRA